MQAKPFETVCIKIVNLQIACAARPWGLGGVNFYIQRGNLKNQLNSCSKLVRYPLNTCNPFSK